MPLEQLENDLLRHIGQSGHRAGDRLPALDELAPRLGISVGKLREQLEVARALGMLSVKPRSGMILEPFDFLPAIKISLLFALARDPHQFEAFSQLRNHVEFSYFHEAAARLTSDDHARLREIVAAAWARLNGSPIRIPDKEHRDLHLTIFSRLGNPFVKGLLEAYWEGYAAVGLNVFSDYSYLCEVWRYHEGIVDAMISGNVDHALNLLVEHTHLLQQRDAVRTTDDERRATVPPGPSPQPPTVNASVISANGHGRATAKNGRHMPAAHRQTKSEKV